MLLIYKNYLTVKTICILTNSHVFIQNIFEHFSAGKLLTVSINFIFATTLLITTL